MSYSPTMSHPATTSYPPVIHVDTTPNPLCRKFSGIPDLAMQNVEFCDAVDAPFDWVADLLSLPDIAKVFLGKGFVTVTKDSDTDWDYLVPFVLNILQRVSLESMPIVQEIDRNSNQKAFKDENEAAMIEQIEVILDQWVRPALNMDGGDIIVNQFRDGILYVQLIGSCSNCPSASLTVKEGILKTLQFHIPEIVDIYQT